MKLLLLAPLVVTAASAWQVNLFSDDNCQNLIFSRGGTGSIGCTEDTTGGPAPSTKSFQYFSDGGVLQLFTAPICSDTLIFSGKDSSDGCTSGLGNGISAFAIIMP